MFLVWPMVWQQSFHLHGECWLSQKFLTEHFDCEYNLGSDSIVHLPEKSNPVIVIRQRWTSILSKLSYHCCYLQPDVLKRLGRDTSVWHLEEHNGLFVEEILLPINFWEFSHTKVLVERMLLFSNNNRDNNTLLLLLSIFVHKITTNFSK